jgi:hypothetical protein
MGAVFFAPKPGGLPSNRFDAPDGDYRICYIGEAPEVAFIETVVRSPDQTRLVLRSALEAKDLSSIATAADLTVVRLDGPGLNRFGLGVADITDDLYDNCRRWALEVWRAYPEVDGIQSRSRWDNDHLCWAIFDRAEAKLGLNVTGTKWLGDRSVHHPLLRHYDMDIG